MKGGAFYLMSLPNHFVPSLAKQNQPVNLSSYELNPLILMKPNKISKRKQIKLLGISDLY